MNKVALAINGRIFEGWKDVQIRLSLRAISGAFSLSVTDRWSGQRLPWFIRPGDEAVLSVNNETVLTGFVDAVSPSFDANSRTIQVSGRDKTCDFVDCSADLGKFEFLNIKLEALARAFAKQFGISVKVVGSTGVPIEKVSINPGETAFEVLEKAARQKGFLLTTDGLGSVLVTRPGKERAATALQQGKNILAAAAQYDFTDRFSDYRVISQFGQLAAELGGAAFEVVGSAKDQSVTRKRTLLISSENSMAATDARTRAQWEATVRAARADKFRVTLQGWVQQDGKLWKPNQLVRVRSDWIGVDSDLLITSVAFSLGSESGSTTELEVERPDAYQPEPEVKKAIDPLAAQIAKELKR